MNERQRPTEPLKRLSIQAIIDDSELEVAAAALEAMIEGIEARGETSLDPMRAEAMRMTAGRFKEIAKLAQSGGEVSAAGWFSVAALVQDTTTRGRVSDAEAALENGDFLSFDQWLEKNATRLDVTCSDRDAMAWAWNGGIEQTCRMLQIRDDEARRLKCYFDDAGAYSSGDLRSPNDDVVQYSYDGAEPFDAVVPGVPIKSAELARVDRVRGPNDLSPEMIAMLGETVPITFSEAENIWREIPEPFATAFASLLLAAVNLQTDLATVVEASAVEAEEHSTIPHARSVIAQSFKDDPGFREGYVANVAMLLHDRHGITDYEARNKAANDILDLIFEDKR